MDNSLFYPDGRPEGVEFVSGAGCAACDYLGFKGRLGLYEYWELNPEVVLAIHRDPGNVREMARRSGLMSMVEDGLNKVQQGITTLEELRRVVPLDQIRYYTNYQYGKEKPKVKGGRRKAKRKKPVEKVGKVEEAEEDDTIDWPLVVHPK